MRNLSVRKCLLATLLAAVGLLFGGCASTHSFKVDAISNPEIVGLQSYHLVSSNAQISQHDLEFKEAADYMRTALSGKGMYEAPTPDDADMVVDLSYGVSEPQVDFRRHSSPVYAMVGGGYRPVRTAVRDSNGNVKHVTTHVYVPPRREYVGSEEEIVPVTTYEKYLRVTARDNRPENREGTPVQAWSVYVKNKDESDDLRKYLPLMAAAALPYVGESTDSQEQILLSEDDDIVDFVKEGM